MPVLLLVIALGVLVARYFEPGYAVIPGVLLIPLYMVFRDPHRAVPSVALGIFSPVDGRVISIDTVNDGATGAPALSIVIAVDSFGTYTARSPVEGTIKDLGKKALWVQTDEGQDIVLNFGGYRLGLAPRAFARYGERLGQGQRCAFLRLTRQAEVQIPVDSKILVEAGQSVVAGIDLIGNLPSLR